MTEEEGDNRDKWSFNRMYQGDNDDEEEQLEVAALLNSSSHKSVALEARVRQFQQSPTHRKFVDYYDDTTSTSSTRDLSLPPPATAITTTAYDRSVDQQTDVSHTSQRSAYDHEDTTESQKHPSKFAPNKEQIEVFMRAMSTLSPTSQGRAMQALYAMEYADSDNASESTRSLGLERLTPRGNSHSVLRSSRDQSVSALGSVNTSPEHQSLNEAVGTGLAAAASAGSVASSSGSSVFPQSTIAGNAGSATPTTITAASVGGKTDASPPKPPRVKTPRASSQLPQPLLFVDTKAAVTNNIVSNDNISKNTEITPPVAAVLDALKESPPDPAGAATHTEATALVDVDVQAMTLRIKRDKVLDLSKSLMDRTVQNILSRVTLLSENELKDEIAYALTERINRSLNA